MKFKMHELDYGHVFKDCKEGSWESYIFCLDVCVQCNVLWAMMMIH